MIDWALKICIWINWRKKKVEPCLVITTYSTAVVLRCVALHCGLCCVVFCYTLLYCIVLCFLVSKCFVLCLFVFCCVVLLYYIVLCGIDPLHIVGMQPLGEKNKINGNWDLFSCKKILIVLSSRLAAFPRMCWGFAVSYCITLDVELIYFLPAVGLSALLPEIIRD